MSQRQWIVIIGVWVMVFLFLGFPSSWEKALAILTGLLVIFMAYRIKIKENFSAGSAPFTDNLSEKDSQNAKADPFKQPVSVDPTASAYQNQPVTPDANK